MASTYVMYKKVGKYIANGSVDFDTDQIKLALVSSVYAFNNAHVNWVGGLYTWAATTVHALNDRIKPTTANGHWYLCTTAGTSGASEPTWVTNGSTVTDGTAVWTDQGVNPAACEVSGSGYTAGGKLVENFSFVEGVHNDPLDTVHYGKGYTEIHADDVVFANSTITARRGILYRVGTVNGVENPLIGCILFNDAPADVSSTNSDFTVRWSEHGIHRLSYPIE